MSTKNVYKVPSEVMPLVKQYHDLVRKLLEDKARMELDYTNAMAACLKKVAEAKALACNATAALVGVTLGIEDQYDIDTAYLEQLGIAVLQHMPADEKVKTTATDKNQIN